MRGRKLKILKIVLKVLGIVLAVIFALIITLMVLLEVTFGNDMIVNRPLGESTSPDGKHLCVVFVSDGGATTPYTVVAQISGTWIIGKRTVYAVDNIEDADFHWVDNRTIRINGVSLDIYKDYYGGDIYDLEPK